MSIIVYWLEKPDVQAFFPNLKAPQAREFGMDKMSEALSFCQAQRNDGCRHVTMSIENPDQVGKLGVDSIVDGKTPDGHDYTWMKRRSQ